MQVKKRIVRGVETERYYVIFHEGGKKHYKCTGHTDKRKADKWARDYVADVRSKKSAIEVLETIRQKRLGIEIISFKEAWKRHCQIAGVRTKAQEDKSRKRWEDFTDYCKSRKVEHIAAITEKLCRDYLDRLKQEGRFSPIVYKRGRKTISNSVQKGLSEKTRRDYRLVMQAVLNATWRDSGLATHPMEFLPPIKFKSQSRDAFSVDQLKLLLARADPYTYHIVMLGSHTGMDRGDICTLEWKHVDLESGWISRERKKTGNGYVVYMLPDLREYLTKLPKHGSHVHPKLAEDYNRQPGRITRRFHHLLAEVGLVEKRQKIKTSDGKVVPTTKDNRHKSAYDIHSLRHTFVWLAAEAGIPLPIIQGMVGHMTPKMTQMYAAHAKRQDIKKAMIGFNLLGESNQ